MMVKAVVFDMDGVLIDSEPLWRKAELTVFHHLGIPITEADCIRLMGLRTDEVVNQLLADYQSDLAPDSIVSDILDEVCRLIREEGEAVSAIQGLVLELAELQVPLAVATSSPIIVVNEVLAKTDLDSVFRSIVSAQFFPHGKPHPMVYLEACSTLGLHPGNCLAVEDSINGVLAAKAARMKVVAMPAKADLERKEFGIADFVAPGPEAVGPIVLPLLGFA
jgi:HAD superfamily hydrolase (TIGR01509 family)